MTIAEELKQFRRERLIALRDGPFEGNANALGIFLGYKDGAFVRQMISGYREISEKTIMKVHEHHAYQHWFDMPKEAEPQSGLHVIAIDPEDELPEHLVLIPESTVRPSAGHGKICYEECDTTTAKAYDRQWLAQQRLNPRYLRRFRVSGISMERTLFHDDIVLVNELEKEPVSGHVYALLVGDEFRVKRLYTKVGGILILHSDNPDWVPRQEEYSAQQAQELIHIIGRVRDRSGSGGL